MEKVLVTGSTGFIGLHCIHQLIEKGYSVNGTLRSKSREEEVRSSLKKANLSDANLSLYECDLMSDDGWEKAIDGCDYVLHIASPFINGLPDHEDELIKPALTGTQRILKLSATNPQIKKIIITSSFAAVGDTFNGQTVFNESDWSDPNNNKISAYNKSKTLAEKSAWDFMESNPSFKLTVINPVGVIGPMLSDDIGTSNLFVKKILDGSTPGNPGLHIGFVDVRDVARAHVDSIKNEKSDNKRIILSKDEIWVSELSEILRNLGYKAPKRNIPKWLISVLSLFDKQLGGLIPMIGKVRNIESSIFSEVFDWELISIEESAKVTAEQLKSMNQI
jgi:dihydroflavonol-4-reductase|tara:strand:- start:412 stop:1413 length:1002 start_codon:yes stop_codon:yes gene_type:complete